MLEKPLKKTSMFYLAGPKVMEISAIRYTYGGAARDVRKSDRQKNRLQRPRFNCVQPHCQFRRSEFAAGTSRPWDVQWQTRD